VELNNKKLIENQDYELIYSNNINVGQATILIKAKGKYKGEKQFNFNIEKSNNQITKFEIDKDLNIIVESIFGIPDIKYFSDQECTNQLDNKPTQPGTYYVKAFVNGTDNYEQVDKIIEFNIKETNKNNIPLVIGLTIGTLLGLGIIVALIIFIKKLKK
ncbi:MAG: hypothetical protein IJ970_01240, partial [Mycoplasmataceae bacterium]|nr:hypothetical protein [Mycoplasmataceae bacterium]